MIHSSLECGLQIWLLSTVNGQRSAVSGEPGEGNKSMIGTARFVPDSTKVYVKQVVSVNESKGE